MTLTPLLILQLSCCSATIVCFAALVFARLQVMHAGRNYELSRALILCGLALLIAQFVVQMTMGIRAGGAVQGAVVNILFYVPTVGFLSMASLRISTASRARRLYVLAAVIGTILIYAVFLAGLFIYKSLTMPIPAYIMGVLFLGMCVFLAFAPNRERRHMRIRLERNALVDISAYNQFMHAGVVLLSTLSLTMALAIFSTHVLFVLGPFFELGLVYFVISFICLDARMGVINSEIEQVEVESEQLKMSDEGVLSDEYMKILDARIADWQQRGGYADIDLNMATMAQQLDISPHILSQYLQQRSGLTFRVWLSELRIEEVKKMLLEHEDFKMEAIALACGFSSRTWLQQKFKAATGMTPSDWRAQQIPTTKTEKPNNTTHTANTAS